MLGLKQPSLLLFFCAAVFWGVLFCTSSFADIRRKMTVAQVREMRDSSSTTVLFLQSQRFYRLETHTKRYRKYLRILKKSAQEHIPCTVTLPNEESGTILRVF
jgi:hypothetical protein